ncbi:MAG TPA: hypothetical protein VF461_20470 [Gemmatimonadaceae bacterium]
MRERISSSAARVALLLGGLLSVALACHDSTAPHVPVGAVALTPPARFAMWWRLTEACSAATGDFASVEWYVVPNTTTLTYENTQVDAFWLGNPDRIVLADARRNDGPIVRHEMLHALLHRNGHPRDAFLTACGGVVQCDGACAVETGGYASPPDAAPELQPREVNPRVDVFTPLPAELAGDGGAVAALITITNPRTEPVWVRLTPRESGDFQYPTFGVIVDNDDPARIAAVGADYSPGGRFALGAGESRRWIWEGALARGRFGVLGYFNADTVPRRVITVGQ